MVTKVILYALMFAAVAGLLWANKQFKAKGAIWARPLSIILGVFAVILAIVATYAQLSPTTNTAVIDEYRTREATFQRYGAKALGSVIAQKHPTGKAFLIVPKYMMDSDPTISSTVIDGLKEGMGGSIELFSTEKVFDGTLPESAMGEDGMPPEVEEELYSAKVFDQLVNLNKDCKIIITLCGLPPDFKEMGIWRVKDANERPVVYMYSSDIYELQLLIKHGLVGGCVVDKPEKFDIREEIPADEQAAFDKRFILITPENVDEIAGKYPLFKKEKK